MGVKDARQGHVKEGEVKGAFSEVKKFVNNFISLMMRLQFWEWLETGYLNLLEGWVILTRAGLIILISGYKRRIFGAFFVCLYLC